MMLAPEEERGGRTGRRSPTDYSNPWSTKLKNALSPMMM